MATPSHRPAGALVLAACLALLAASALRCATGCAALQAAAPALEKGAELACEAFLPLATDKIPGPVGASLRPLDVLGCQFAEQEIAAALAAAPAPPVLVGQSVVLAYRPLKDRRGRVEAWVRADPRTVEGAQAALDVGKDGGR